jgi:hypothetical protein
MYRFSAASGAAGLGHASPRICGRLRLVEALLQFRQRGVEGVLQHVLHGFRRGGDAL